MRSKRFRRVLMWDPHPLARGQQRFWSKLQRVQALSWRVSTSYSGISEAAQSLRKVSALVRAGLPARDAWLQVGEGEEGVPYGVASIVLKQAGEHARMVTAACAVSYELGAPLSAVLDALAQNFDDIESIQKARRVAGQAPPYPQRSSTYCHCWHWSRYSSWGLTHFLCLLTGEWVRCAQSSGCHSWERVDGSHFV